MEYNEIKKQNKWVYKSLKFIREYWWQTLLSALLVTLTALMSSLFIASDANWFLNLARPEFYPENWLFSAMWVSAYALVAIGLIKTIKKGGNRKLLLLYGLNGILNILWNVIFFGMASLFGGVIILVILIILAYLLLRILYKTDKTAFYLTLPYFIAILFSFLLGYSMYFLN